MKTIRLGIGSNDGETIAPTHLGDTREFHVHDLFADGREIFVETRANHVRSMDHAKEDKMKSVLGILGDVDVLVSRRRSPNFLKMARKTDRQPVVVHAATIPEALAVLRAAFPDLAALVEARKAGKRSETIPEYAAG